MSDSRHTPSASTASTVQRSVGLPADSATVRALMQEMAATGWVLLPDSAVPPHVRVVEAGAGSSEVQVAASVEPGEEQQAWDALNRALTELVEHVLRRTSDAS